VATPARPVWTIRPETALSEHARTLRRVHDAVLSGQLPVSGPDPSCSGPGGGYWPSG
jgi:hypothetical protein